MNSKVSYILVFGIVLMFTGFIFAADVSPPVPWFGETWKFRQIVLREMVNPTVKSSTGITEIDTQGNILPGGADIRITDMLNNIVPFRILSVSKEGLVRVEFRISESEAASAYCVYYGDPTAKPLAFKFEQDTGGINLAVKAYEGGEVTDIATFTSLFDAAKRVIGQGTLQSISDDSIPFSKEYVQCLAQYEGIIRMPQDGSYGFQLKATGPAFVSIDGKTVLSQQKAEGLYSTVDAVPLMRGDHLVRFCVFSRHPSSYIAKLYWRIPGERIFQAIPSENFSSSIYYAPVIRQSMGRILNAFFTANIERKIRMLRTEDVLTKVKFSNLSYDSLGIAADMPEPERTSSSIHVGRRIPIVKSEWDFGDGQTSRGDNPVHIYRRTGQYTATLTTTNDMGYRDNYSVQISISDDNAEKIELEWDVQEDSQLIEYDTETISIRHSFYLTGLGKKDLTLEKSLITEGGIEDSEKAPLRLLPREPVLQSYSIPNRKGSFGIKWNLYLSDISIMNKGLRIIEDTDRFPKVFSKDASLMDADGNLVIVKVTGEPNSVKRLFRNAFQQEKDKTLDIAIIDNSLAPFGEGYNENDYYYGKLKSLLKKQFSNVEVNIHRFAGKRDQLGYFAVYRIVSYASSIYKIDPDIVVISPDFDDLRSLTEPDFRYYAIMIHNYIANTRAKIILVTPPPRIEGTNRGFAMGVSKIALIHEVGLADIHQAVSMYDGDWKSLFSDGSGTKNVYYYDMNPEGQNIIAETLFRAITRD